MLNAIDLGIVALYIVAEQLVKRKRGTYESPDPLWGSLLMIGPLSAMRICGIIWAATMLIPQVDLHLYEVIGIFIAVNFLLYGNPYHFLASPVYGKWAEAAAKYSRIREMRRETAKRKKEKQEEALGNQNLHDFLKAGGGEEG